MFVEKDGQDGTQGHTHKHVYQKNDDAYFMTFLMKLLDFLPRNDWKRSTLNLNTYLIKIFEIKTVGLASLLLLLPCPTRVKMLVDLEITNFDHKFWTRCFGQTMHEYIISDNL